MEELVIFLGGWRVCLEMIEELLRVVSTLKTLDVRGWDSMDRLVGCVMALERMISEIQNTNSEDENGR